MSRSLAAVMVIAAATTLVTSGSEPGGLRWPNIPLPPPQDEIELSLRTIGAPFRLGLPDLQVAAADGPLEATAVAISGVLWDDLDFEHEFDMIPRPAAALMVPAAMPDALPYAAWVGLGADGVLVGSARLDRAGLVIGLRLLSTRPGRQGEALLARTYTCALTTTRAPRDCAHQIADDLHQTVRGLAGVARTRLAFVSDRDHGRLSGADSSSFAGATELYVSDYDGANQARLTANRSLTCCPAWSPADHSIAYASWLAGPPDLYQVAGPDAARHLSHLIGAPSGTEAWSPAWSPDGRRLAFASNRSGNLDIWVVNADGRDLRNLTHHPGQEGTPTWSPDGSLIAFTSNRSGKNSLYVMSAAGSVPRLLVDEQVDRPTWSALNVIAFTLDIDGGRHVVATYDVNTSRVSVLTPDSDGENPVISPNGRHIAFVTSRWGGQQIATMDRTGANVRRITTAGRNRYPSWEPAR